MAITRAQQARQMYKKGSMKPIKQAGVMNYMPSEMVTVPKIAKSSPDTPTAKLAYITPKEQDILIDLNLYGSLDGKPNRGPGGIPSLEGDFGGGDTYSSPSDSNKSSSSGSNKDDGPSPRDLAMGAGGKQKKGTVTDLKELQKLTGTDFSGGPDDRGNVLQNRNQRNIVEYNKNIKKIEDNKDLNFIEKFNAKKRLKNQRFINQKYSRLASGIAQKYGLSQDQIQALLDAYDRDLDEFDLSTFRGIVDAGAPPSIRSTDPNFLKAEMLDYSKRMSKIDPETGKRIPLSTAELFSTTDPTSRIELPSPFLNALQGPESFSNVLSGLNRLKTLDTLSNIEGGVPQDQIDNYFNLTAGKGGKDPITGEEIPFLFNPKDDNDRSMTVTDPCKGPNPPAYCFIGGNAPTTPDPVFTPSFRFMNRGGMVEDAPMGGIMDLDTTRQMLFIGGIAKGISKGIKGITRAAKKVVKSPFGKAAILGAIGFGIPGTSFTGLLKGKGASFSLGDILKKSLLKDSTGAFSLENLSGGKIAALSGLAGLIASKQTEEDGFDIDKYYEEEGLRDYIASLGPRYRLGTFNAAKGGKAEPVAKKVMPLLDMDGKEMDLREDGGFVPIGRMEKADDVPARLSKNEFVFTADAVRNAGEGDVDKGAEVMYNMMKNLEAGGEVSEESQGLDGAREMFQTAQRLEGVM